MNFFVIPVKNCHLTPAFRDQYDPANCGQGHWLFHTKVQTDENQLSAKGKDNYSCEIVGKEYGISGITVRDNEKFAKGLDVFRIG